MHWSNPLQQQQQQHNLTEQMSALCHDWNKLTTWYSVM
jgi:hypothetical protein